MIRLFQRLMGQCAAKDQASDEAARNFLDAPLSQTAPLQPPAVANDDLLRDLFVEVARELRVAGYLR